MYIYILKNILKNFFDVKLGVGSKFLNLQQVGGFSIFWFKSAYVQVVILKFSTRHLQATMSFRGPTPRASGLAQRASFVALSQQVLSEQKYT